MPQDFHEPLNPGGATTGEPKKDEEDTFCSKLQRCKCLSAGEPKKDQDAFEHCEAAFHPPGHSLYSKHGIRCCKIADEFLGFALIAIFEVWKSAVVAYDLVMLLGGQAFTSMSAVKLANDIIEWAIVTGVCLMWMTFCYWHDGVHSFWKLKIWPLPSLMPGGFMPRLAAFSLGILMFTTSTLVSEGRVEGKKLSDKFDSDKWELCRATDMEAQGASDMWFGRVLRRPPAVHEDGSDFTCFKTRLLYGNMRVKPSEFNSTDLANYSNALISKFNSTDLGNDEALNTGVETPWNGRAPLSQSRGFPMEDLVNWGLFDGSDFPLFSFNCMYQCSKWKSVGLMDLIKNIGTIVAGSAVVVKTSDSISKNFGGNIFGLPLVTEDTDDSKLLTVLKATRSRPGQSRSKFFAAIACVLCSGPLRFASKLDSNGYYTVDYYVTAVFFSSLLMACMVRQFNPYKLMRIAYTKNMWLLGEDSFICLKTHEYKKLNLYEWIHLSERARGDHLLNCARMLTTKDIDKELKMRKDIRTADAKAKEPKKEDDPPPSVGCFVSRKKEDEKDAIEKSRKKAAESAPEMYYHNKHAKVTVKVLKEISFVTTSPPVGAAQKGSKDDSGGLIRLAPQVKDDSEGGGNMIRGVVQKVVVVRRNAVGTVIDKLDEEHIIVRFPLEVPENVPLLYSSQPHVGLVEKEGKMVLITVPKKDAKDRERLAPVLSAGPKKDVNKGKYKAVEMGPGLAQWDAAHKDGSLKRKPWRQYAMTLTPSPKDKNDKKSLNSWLHNACLELKKPMPHNMKDLEKQERLNLEKNEDDEDTKEKRKDDPDWEDVVVPLRQVMEVSKEWMKIENVREGWYN